LPEPPLSELTVPAAAAWYAVQDGERTGDHWNGGPAAGPGHAVGLATPGVPAGQGNGSARPVPYQSRWLVTLGTPEQAPSGDGLAAAETEPPAQMGSPVEATPSDEALPAEDDGPSGEEGPANTP
jgi:hypothetical protein